MNTSFYTNYVHAPKKHWTALLLCCFLASTATGQRLDIFGGINPSGIRHQVAGTRQNASGTIGYHFGMAVLVPFNAKAYNSDDGGYGIFPALQFIKKGTSKSSLINASAADIKLGYLQLNLPLSYTAGSYGIGIGPYMAYALSGTKKYRVGSGAKEKIDFGNDLKRVDYGIGINLNISLFRIQYEFGLANLATGANSSAKTRALSLSLDIPLVQE
ncbi:hypothetical protein DBR32_03100 [Taibaiella sp. KBW10]|uniref:outer membrane beta-barrel protein n=1 Tax=Taibaiella sp. KBW10 TaxID=2153357 RepID=UPI000F5B0065|nr:outer membrane beta-barrel protein [Taibaiella sp. KBW10]RQO32597.1 hypothetical protein DBR32_03100 [Taibaiella sp. KBW10]